MNKPVYVKIKPQYEHTSLYKYIAYFSSEDILIDKILFMRKPYNLRKIIDERWDIISEEEFKLEVL